MPADLLFSLKPLGPRAACRFKPHSGPPDCGRETCSGAPKLSLLAHVSASADLLGEVRESQDRLDDVVPRGLLLLDVLALVLALTELQNECGLADAALAIEHLDLQRRLDEIHVLPRSRS